MKNLLLVLLLFAGLQGYSQTFKVNSVETSESSDYQDLNKKWLNTSIKATFNDGSVTLNQVGKNQPLTLKKVSDNQYSFSSKSGWKVESYNLKFNTTFGVISEMELRIVIQHDKQYKTSILKAKRW